MKEAGYIIIILAILFAVIYFANRAYQTLHPPAESHRWRLQDHSDEQLLVLYAECTGEEPILIGSASIDNPDFEYLAEELRAKGIRRVAALNSVSTELRKGLNE